MGSFRELELKSRWDEGRRATVGRRQSVQVLGRRRRARNGGVARARARGLGGRTGGGVGGLGDGDHAGPELCWSAVRRGRGGGRLGGRRWRWILARIGRAER